MTLYANGQYDTTKPWTRPPMWTYAAPNQSNEERRVQEALAVMTMPGASLADTVRPPMDIPLFRPRYGYRQRALGIADIIEVDRNYAPANYTQTDAGAQGAARNSWGNGTW